MVQSREIGGSRSSCGSEHASYLADGWRLICLCYQHANVFATIRGASVIRSVVERGGRVEGVARKAIRSQVGLQFSDECSLPHAPGRIVSLTVN